MSGSGADPEAARFAAQVAAGDPDRFAATMAGPAPLRDRLWPLYALNLELARAPWASPEPMLAEMRLAWWAEVLEGGAGGHELLAPLRARLAAAGLTAAPLAAIARARAWDCWSDPFEDDAGVAAYLDDTAGTLMWVAARLCGAAPGAEAQVRDFAFGAGLAAFFVALPELAARGRRPLPDGSPAAIRALAGAGRARIARARAARGGLPAIAMLPGWQADGILARAAAAPERVAAGRLRPAEIARRAGLAWRGLTGRW